VKVIHTVTRFVTLNLLTTTIVAPPSNASKWQMGFNSAFKGLTTVLRIYVGGDTSVDIAARYGLDGPGIEYVWGLEFPQPSRSAVRLTQPTIQWVPGLSRG
jgi:hypothetical protein